ncbi:MAG: hypothetical protein HYX34_04035 [Actinobacteria bacterium]|nr:hypothetical protein [Actinomycetota bacterium]
MSKHMTVTARLTAKAPPRPVVHGVVRTRRFLQRLADRLVPADIAVFERSVGLAATMVLGTLADLGIAELLAAGPAPARELATRTGTDPDALHRLLRAAASQGFVGLDKRGRFRANRFTKVLRAKGNPHELNAWCRYISAPSTVDAWQDLRRTLDDGRNAFRRIHGMSTWEWFATHPDEERTFAAAMRGLTEQEAPGIVAAYPWPHTGTLCDIAGGAGTLVGHILQARPRLRGIVVDATRVLAEADSHLRRVGVRERVDLVPGDIFGALDATADVYVMKNVLHDWDDAACARILGGVAATMPRGSRLVVMEASLERNEPHPFAAVADIQMMVICEEGRERSVDELRALVHGAGLTPAAVRTTATDLALLEATKP